jgi:uncharacterized protein YjbI with pentapeptide repeats
MTALSTPVAPPRLAPHPDRLLPADLTGAILRGADLTGADLRRAVLVEADLSRSILHGAQTKQADFTGAQTGGARGLDPADLRAA